MTDRDSPIVLKSDRDNVRLDVYLTEELDTSRNKVQQAIKDGGVYVNDAVIQRASHRLRLDDELTVNLSADRPITLHPEALPLDIVFEDESLIVINKAAGMAVHPGAGRPSGTLVNALLHHVGATPGGEEGRVAGLSTGTTDSSNPIRPGIVHRLDMNTSGLMVVAKTDFVHRSLQAQFEDRTIDRQYAGIVWGIPESRSGEITGAVGRDVRVRTRMAVTASGRPALTRYETLETFPFASLLRFRLKTGRTHQIRVHAKHIGHPILGDTVYNGDTIRYGPVSAKRRAFYRNILDRLPRQALHAQKLGFIHPQSGEHMCWVSDWPADMAWVLSRLNLDPG